MRASIPSLLFRCKRSGRLTLMALALLGQARATELPLFLGAPLPAVTSNMAHVACLPPTDPLELAVWRVTTAGGRPDLSCGNAFVEYQRLPRSSSAPVDAFDQIAAQIREAKSEVLLASMEWHAGEGRPGWTVALAVRDLYARVQANPAAYPQGMSVRLMLGNFPDLQRADWATLPLALVRDLRTLGVPLQDAGVGWSLSVLNYRYFPHSHVKLHVIDGRDLTVAGFNFTDTHLPLNERNGGLHDLHDLGLRMTGPVAQDGVAAFDDLWRHSRQVRCPGDVRPEQVGAACTLGDPDRITHPAAATEAVTTGTARAFMLHRRPGVDQADRAHLSLLGAATTQIDLMQATFSPLLTCWYAYLNPDECTYDTLPVYLRAVVDAIGRGVRVRVLMVDYGIDTAANRSGAALVRLMARQLGKEELFEARYTTFAMHTKALAVDGRMVLAGSMNFHFSAWGSLGLAEAALATSDLAAVQQQKASFEDVWANGSRPVPREWWMRNVASGSAATPADLPVSRLSHP
ncbi:phospholipase D-like domain-containing protein [Deinococcus sp. QL22]|uniref:phospholipase D-like domain-containing protein n=1 Tax=Deinococcus sp. QL22 TaxID=2939437 RepID=UPI002017C499|nr:phospholipase D-like domain-containing protein [Deinococcus sp. QL22]UQN06363.1 phospholipase D-like domain-containing protein [Deinococcus sp. QL22]